MLNTKRLRFLIIPILSAAAFIILILGSAAAVSFLAQEFDLNPAGFASEINVAADGNLWITDNGADEIWLIDVIKGTYTSYTNINSPVDARADSLGNAWWTFDIDSSNQGIGQLDIISQTIQLWPLLGDGSPWGTALDSSGRLWVTNSSDPLLHRFDLNVKELCTYTIPTTGSGGSDYILYRDGSVWLADTFNEQIIRFNPQSSQYTTWALEESALPVGLIFDEAGNFWWADSTLNQLGRLNPTTNLVTTYTVPTDSLISVSAGVNLWPLKTDSDRLGFLANAASVPVHIAARDGVIWFTDWLGVRVGSLDPQTAAGSSEIVPSTTMASAAPLCQIIEPLSSSSANFTSGGLQWADHSYDVVKDSEGWFIYQLPQDSTPWGMAADVNNVWLTDQGRQKLGRLELRKCFQLSRSKLGSGSLPQTTPNNSVDCPSSSYIEGEVVGLTAQPAVGWRVGGWSGTDNDASQSTTNLVTMPAAAHSVTVSYEPIPPTCYQLTLNHTGSGADPLPTPGNSPGCSAGSYAAGEAIDLSAKPSPGWQVGGWTGTDDDAGKGLTNALTMPAANHLVSVRYELGQNLFLPIVIQ